MRVQRTGDRLRGSPEHIPDERRQNVAALGRPVVRNSPVDTGGDDEFFLQIPHSVKGGLRYEI